MPLTPQDVEFLRDVVATHSGNVIVPRQLPMLEQRLAPLAEAKGFDDIDTLIEKLRTGFDLALSAEIAEAVTVNETSFFRDSHLFEALRSDIIPDLISLRSSQQRLHIWCAACSSGQEPYSLAMLLVEDFPFLRKWDVRILATDICEPMLSRSRAGEYTEMEIKRGLPHRYISRFFHRDANIYRVNDELRSMIDHQRLNLTREWPSIGTFDIVLIRNVLIYFDQETKAGVLRRIGNVLEPTGHLFIGSAEMLIGLGVPFTRQEINGTISYRPNRQ